jgi:hypothetical protein
MLNKKVLLASILTAGVLSQAFGAIVPTKIALMNYLDTAVVNTGKLIYVKETDGCMYWVDFSQAALSEQKVANTTPVISPLISPSGSLVTFWTGTDQSGTIYACSLLTNTTPVVVASGFDPHWWIEAGTGKVFIIYSTVTGKLNWPQLGQTLKQEINPNTFAKIGTASVLLANSFNGGLSKNGRYLCTAYESTDMYEFLTSTHMQLNNNIQSCNASITPATTPARQNRMMHLSLGQTINSQLYQMHQVFMIRNFSDVLLWYIEWPPGTDEWQKPEWSTHENFAVATAKRTSGGEYNVYIVKIATIGTVAATEPESESPLRVVDGNNTYPHLWVAKTIPPGIRPHSPSIDELTMALSISPNPAGRTVKVTIPSQYRHAAIGIYTTDGKLCAAWTNAANCTWDAAGYPAGVYLVTVSVNGTTATRRLMIRK